jgi:hypothetical protein
MPAIHGGANNGGKKRYPSMAEWGCRRVGAVEKEV